MAQIDENSCILIADDIQTTRHFIIRLLQDLGYTNFLEASDGEDAWKKLKNEANNIKIFLCDWNMPKINGLELLKKIKEDPKLKDLPFIMVTAESDLEHTTAAILNGASGYINKPFDNHVLMATLNQTIKRYNQAAEKK
jgi:two-component system chemotaxis response regulator CheY